MRLADLNPRWWRIYRDRDLTPDNGGFPTDEFDLHFRCPGCGAPYTLSIRVGPQIKHSPRTWAASPLPDGADWPERVTISPSINHTTSGHGPRHPTCGFHGTIINGEIVPG